jgi:DNA repair protein SbcD/Mre11
MVQEISSNLKIYDNFRKMVKILHTSDWHLGRSLYDKKRYDEFESFLNWLTEFIREEKIDILLVSGDVFDTTTPGNRAQELYYGFLGTLSSTGCRHAVIIGGNHDSPTFLDAPKNILKAIKIHVVGEKTENPEDEVFVLRNQVGESEAIVCAVPYLRDRDIRTVDADESPEDKTEKLIQGIANHYSVIAGIAGKLNTGRKRVPVIGMGHLFTNNGRTSDGDGVRELYIGSIVHIDGERISKGFDYMALGHLHIAQKAGNAENVRYCGSPIPMGFGEARQTKKVIVVEFSDDKTEIREFRVPSFRDLVKITGDINAVSEEIEVLKSEGSEAWLEIEITSLIFGINLAAHFGELLAGSKMEILKTKNMTIVDRALAHLNPDETLENLSVGDVFNSCLESYEIASDEQHDLFDTYLEAIHLMEYNDTNAN